MLPFNEQYTSIQEKIKKSIEMFAGKLSNISAERYVLDKGSQRIYTTDVIANLLLLRSCNTI